MVKEGELDKIYHAAHCILDNVMPASEYFPVFELATRSENKSARILAASMLIDHFEKFDKDREVQERLYGMLSDKERDVRRTIINGLPKLIKRGRNVGPVCNVLAQLLVIEDRLELNLVRNSLGKILFDFPGQCFYAMRECATEAGTVFEKLKIAQYLEERFPCYGRDLVRITEEFAVMYLRIIEEVEKPEDFVSLFNCLRANGSVRYSVVIDAFGKRVGTGNFSPTPVIDFIGNCRKQYPFHLTSLETTLARMSFVLTVFNKSCLQTFEIHYQHFLKSGFVKCCEMREVATKVVNAMLEEGFRRGEDPEKLVFRLTQIFVLSASIPSSNVQSVVSKWMRRNADIIRTMDRQERRNFLVLLASFSAKCSSRAKRDSALAAIIQFVIEILPPANFRGPSMNFERYDLEAACFLLKNVVKRNEASYQMFENMEPNWRARLSTLMEILRQTTQVLNDEMQSIDQSPYRLTLSRKLHVLNQCGICIFLFTGNRFRDNVQVYPTWTSENSVFNGPQLTNILTKNNDVEVVLDDVKRRSRPPLIRN